MLVEILASRTSQQVKQIVAAYKQGNTCTDTHKLDNVFSH